MKTPNSPTRKDYILASSKTAITRKDPSVPMRFLDKAGLLEGDLLDYGCGKGKDKEFYGMAGYDPIHRTREQNEIALGEGFYDVVTCNYVLNTLPLSFQNGIIKKIKAQLKEGGRAFITVRRDNFKEGWNSRGTYQRDVRLPMDLYRTCSSYDIYTFQK